MPQDQNVLRERTYTVHVTFTVDTHSNEHLQSERSIRDELRSWLEGLGACVDAIRVTKETRTG